MEILAPAGSPQAIKAAVLSGADAVYFGAGDFNARRNAQNFTNDDLFDAVKYCHLRGVRAYLTLNTLVCDEEINNALATAKTACEAGIDAIIIQDMGLASLIRKAAPNMPLHASTQMTVHNLSGVRYLHQHGYERVVLSREVSRAELIKISDYANQHGIELEIFVQGALCMSVSGQCLFSALLGGRSGNRGLCAGTCRLPFTVKGGNGYDLSLKDNNLYGYFDEFSKMKISSLKIEGRMKRPEYVAMAVDCAVTARDNPDALPDKLDRLMKIFSRSGFTDGYYTGKTGKEMFGVRSEQDIENSKEIMNSAHELYRREYPHVAVNMSITVRSGENICLTVTDGKNSVTVSGDEPQIANNRPAGEEYIRAKLEKCGSTPYYLDKLDVTLGDGLAVASSALNALKTKALELLSAEREKVEPIKWNSEMLPESARNMRKIGDKKLIGAFHSASQIPEQPRLDMCILPLDTPDDDISKLVNSGKNIALCTPPYFTDDEKVLCRLCRVKELGVYKIVAENIGAVPLIKEAGIELIVGSRLNVFNSYSAGSELIDEAEMICLSRELSTNQINGITTSKPLCTEKYGRLPLFFF